MTRERYIGLLGVAAVIGMIVGVNAGSLTPPGQPIDHEDVKRS
jgi:hypothetical protein